MGGPCATGSSAAAEISATGCGAISGSITTGSLTDSNDAALSATGSGADVSNTGVAGSKATGVQEGSGAIGVHTGSGIAGSVQVGASAKTGSSFEAGGMSAKLSIISAGAASITCGSPTVLNSASSVAGAETVSKSATAGFSGSGTMSETGSTIGISTSSAFCSGAGVRGTKFSTAGPTMVI